MELELNGERRQYENTGDMVYTCADIVQYASLGATLEVGDVITTGTPEGVSELHDGDTIDAEIEDVGSMTVDVTGRDVSYADANVQKGGQD
jgi:2-keto-4-pentenoate hydratase/2-oxohepta-3-ene-1,7-dioic acid hydratase in catechol pathway